MLQDAVVAIVPEGRLSDLLPAIHRAGMGYLTRVATPARGPLLDQLQRAGIPVSQAPDVVRESNQVLFINAGGRAVTTASLLLQHLPQVWIVNGLGAWNPVDDQVITTNTTPAPQTDTPQSVPGRRTIAPLVTPAPGDEPATSSGD